MKDTEIKPKKHSECMRRDCNRKYTAQFMLKFIVEKAATSVEGKFCEEHFAQTWANETGPRSMADAFIAKTPHCFLPNRKKPSKT